MFFRKNTYEELLKWKSAPKRKPLVLMGARQVGKTSILKNLGETAFANIAYFNFEENPSLKQFFEGTRDVKRIVQNLSLSHGQPIHPQETLIIFDEIQECTAALNSLKYFCENAPEYAVASAGSLLGISLGKENSFPVGKVDFMHIYPLTFSEFLQSADPVLLEYVNSIEKPERIPDIFFNNLLEKFRMYFISGGMPEPAQTLIADQNLHLAQRQLKDILQAYSMDFSKHADKSDVAKINYIWSSVPAQLARENKKFLYQTVKTGARAREYEDALLWLIQSGLVQKVSRSSKPNIPLAAYDDLSAFKIYLVDVGLLRMLAQLDPHAFQEGNRLFTEFKGALTENYILQALSPQFEAKPRYWTSEGIAEVDFILQHRNEIIPVEVKAANNIRSKSLAFYHQRFKPQLRIRFSLRNLSYENGLLVIPLFLADLTRKFIELEFPYNKKRKGAQ